MNEKPDGLTLSGCRARQNRLREKMRALEIDAALLLDPRHVYYFGGHWEYSRLPVALLIEADEATLVLSATQQYSCAAKIETYEAARLATLVDDLNGAVLRPLENKLSKIKRLGCDRVLPSGGIYDLNPALWQMRRAKDEDEIAMIRRAVAACEAAYARAREILKPGVSEIDVYAQMLATATMTAGEQIGPMGNDFQSGSPGGPPRNRAAQDGELMPLDVSVVVRGYHCDLCRTFEVSGMPTKRQTIAHEAVLGALEYVEETARAGVSCRELYRNVFDILEGFGDWKFSHHLGHGIGLSPHETPRLNPNWNDTLQVGDVFTVEPGLYGEELRAGIRIEHNYVVRENGLERLSQYSTDL